MSTTILPVLQDAPSRGGEATSQPTQPELGPYNPKYELPDKFKRILSQQFGTPVEELPHTYFDHLPLFSASESLQR